MIIVFEGIDGCGKDTQIKLLSDYLTKAGKEVLVINSCSSELLSGVIRKKLKDPNVDNRQLAALFIAELYEHYKDILDGINNNKVIILNRFVYSTMVYNSASIREADAIRMLSLALPPNYVIYLDVSVETALDRLTSRGSEKEIFETKEQLQRVAVGYCYYKKEFTVIDGNKPTLDVHRDIVKAIAI